MLKPLKAENWNNIQPWNMHNIFALKAKFPTKEQANKKENPGDPWPEAIVSMRVDEKGNQQFKLTLNGYEYVPGSALSDLYFNVRSRYDAQLNKKEEELKELNKKNRAEAFALFEEDK